MLEGINFLELSLTIVSMSVAVITLLFYLQKEFRISRRFMDIASCASFISIIFSLFAFSIHLYVELFPESIMFPKERELLVGGYISVDKRNCSLFYWYGYLC